MYTGFQCLPLRILKIFSVASFGSSFSDVIFWTENQCLTTLSWHSFFLSRKAGVSSRLLPLWTCHFFFFFPIYFFLELVKEWVSNNKKIFFSLADPYILMVVLMFPKNRNFEHFKNLSGHIKGTRMKINV